MPKRIEGPYDFSRHAWSNYTDGATWEFIEGEDFTITPKSFAAAARRWARAERLECDTKIHEGRRPVVVAVRFRRKVANIRGTA